MAEIPHFNPSDVRTTIQRAEDWVRTENEKSESHIDVVPQKRWTYYLAIVIAIGLLLAVVTGTGAVLLKKGQNMVQHYIERLYGVDE